MILNTSSSALRSISSLEIHISSSLFDIFKISLWFTSVKFTRMKFLGLFRLDGLLLLLPFCIIMGLHSASSAIISHFILITFTIPYTSSQRIPKKCPILRACLHGGEGPQVGEVTRVAVIEKLNAFTCNLTTPGCWGEFS